VKRHEFITLLGGAVQLHYPFLSRLFLSKIAELDRDATPKRFM